MSLLSDFGNGRRTGNSMRPWLLRRRCVWVTGFSSLSDSSPSVERSVAQTAPTSWNKEATHCPPGSKRQLQMNQENNILDPFSFQISCPPPPPPPTYFLPRSKQPSHPPTPTPIPSRVKTLTLNEGQVQKNRISCWTRFHFDNNKYFPHLFPSKVPTTTPPTYTPHPPTHPTHPHPTHTPPTHPPPTRVKTLTSNDWQSRKTKYPPAGPIFISTTFLLLFFRHLFPFKVPATHSLQRQNTNFKWKAAQENKISCCWTRFQLSLVPPPPTPHFLPQF